MQGKCAEHTIPSESAVAFRVRNIFMLPLTLPCLAAAVSQWYGAAPPATLHPLDRVGWDNCARCSGAERLGAIVDVGDVRHLSAEGIHAIHDAVRAHGVICLKGQNLTRQQQVDLTSALGDQIILPNPGETIMRITGFNRDFKISSHILRFVWKQYDCLDYSTDLPD